MNSEKEGKSDRIYYERKSNINISVIKFGTESRRRKRLMMEKSKLGTKTVGKSTIPANRRIYSICMCMYTQTYYVLIFIHTHI